MLGVVLFVLALPLILRVGYMVLISAWAWRVPDPAPIGSRTQRFVVVIPARNEERVIGRIVRSVLDQDYPADQVAVWVLADRCDDDTAKAAKKAGAKVLEHQGPGDGKGALLAWFMEQHPLADDDAIVILDADNTVPSHLLASFADELEAGNTVLQSYLDVANPDESWLTLASALSYWSAARLVQLPRRNLGWSSQLGGTGMCLTATSLRAAGGYGNSLTEDRDLELRVVESGGRVTWLHHVRVKDEKPPTVGNLTQQRARWATGKRTNRSAHAKALWATARSGSMTALDRFLELMFPSRVLSVVLLAIVLGIALITIGPVPWVIGAGALLMADIVVVFASLIAEKVSASRILRAPLLAVFAVIWLPVQIVSRRQVGWVVTPHSGSESDNLDDEHVDEAQISR